jgi:hypothetical protein
MENIAISTIVGTSSHIMPEQIFRHISGTPRLSGIRTHNLKKQQIPYCKQTVTKPKKKIKKKLFWHQYQASDQFLATTKLATNNAIYLKTNKINKSKMYF